MDLKTKNRFDSALLADDHAGLINLVRQLMAEGLNLIEIYHLFNEAMFHLRKSKREADEDKVADVMDFIVGFCSAEEKLFSTYLTNEEIEDYEQSKLKPD